MNNKAKLLLSIFWAGVVLLSSCVDNKGVVFILRKIIVYAERLS